jgi:hypothetical protein
MFVMGNTNDTVYQYTLSTAWDVSTASYASKSFSVASQEATPLGLWFKPDGLVMYVVGTSSDTVFQYTLGTAWDVSTASYLGVSYNFATQEAQAIQVNLSADGLKMWILGVAGDDIWEYTLGTAWNVSTATPVNNFYIGFQETSPQGLFIDSTTSNRVYLVGGTSDSVFQYYTAANSLKLDTEKLYVDGQLSVNGNFVAGQNAYVDGAITVQGAGSLGSLTVGALSNNSTINLTGATTSTTSLGTAATTGTLSLGGTAQTGIITLGQSTVSQTTNIQAGATASGSTKTINIGTGGLSGSTTDINLGSSVSGSLGSIVANGAFTATGQTSLGGVAGSESLRVLTPTLAGNYAQINTNNFGDVIYGNAGSGTNIPNIFLTKGTGVHKFATNNSVSNTQAQVSHTASAVNFVNLTGNATGSRPVVSSQGSDANIGLNFASKGNRSISFLTNSVTAFDVLSPASGVNYVSVTGSITGVSPIVSATGTDTNIDLTLTPKGTGNVRFGTYTGTILTPTGYVEIKDSGGTVRRLLVG